MPDFKSLLFLGGAFYLFIVELLKLSSIIAFQMISSHVFTFQIDQFHQIFVENLQEELENMKFFTQKHFIKIWIRRRKASNPQGQLQASPQVSLKHCCICFYLTIFQCFSLQGLHCDFVWNRKCIGVALLKNVSKNNFSIQSFVHLWRRKSHLCWTWHH